MLPSCGFSKLPSSPFLLWVSSALESWGSLGNGLGLSAKGGGKATLEVGMVMGPGPNPGVQQNVTQWVLSGFGFGSENLDSNLPQDSLKIR